MGYSNSSLVSHVRLSPNNSGQRVYEITRITPHCVVGHATVEGLGELFANPSRQASSNYGIDDQGRVGMYVEEKNRSWCSSSYDNDQRAVTIEVASDTTDPYTMTTTAYNRLIDLCVDICQRYRKKKLIWIADKDKALAYAPKSDEMLLTVHRWFAKKSCPGDWLYNRLGNLASEVTGLLNAPVTSQKTGTPGDGNVPHTWSEEAVKWAVSRGILKGSSSGAKDYRLNDPVTREEVLTFIHRAMKGGD